MCFETYLLLLSTFIAAYLCSSNKTTAQTRWANLKEHGSNVATPIYLLRYIERKNEKFQKNAGYHHNSPKSLLLLWDGVKKELLENTNKKNLRPKSDLPNAIGMCVTGVNVLGALFSAFVVDEGNPHTEPPSWIFIEFYPKCCLWETTNQVEFHDIRECTLTEQSVLIQDTLRRNYLTYSEAIRKYRKK